MKALVLEKGGSIDGFCVKDIEIPEIKPDELLVKVHATGLNPSDFQTAEYMQGEGLNLVLGLDIAGEVAKVGSEVTGFNIGDRVFYLRKIDNPNGGFAEYAVTPERFVSKIPEGVSYEQAATLPGAGFTAYHIMEQRSHTVAGRTILIQGGAGGVGSYAIQLSKLAGLRVITTCLGRDLEYVRSLGADVAIDFQNEDVYARISEETNGEGVDYALSSIGSKGATADLKILRFGGELAVTAGLPEFDGWKFYERGISLHEVAFGGYLTSQDEALQRIPAQIGKNLVSLLKEDKIHAPKMTKIGIEDIPANLRLMKAGEVTGKIVVTI